MDKWKILSSQYILRRKWMDVREDRVQLPTGVIIDEFHVLEYPDWVCVLPLTNDEEVVMVQQYRHGVERVCVEFPAGVVEPGEDVMEAAKRELLEETGYEATDWEYLGDCAPEPSRHSNRAHMVVARGGARAHAPRPDENEVISVRTLPVTELRQLIASDEFVHGVHHAALLLASLKGIITL
jgi:8-oxo-dGTP pyrophosphatase MutT (NUDIX family)